MKNLLKTEKYDERSYPKMIELFQKIL